MPKDHKVIQSKEIFVHPKAMIGFKTQRHFYASSSCLLGFI